MLVIEVDDDLIPARVPLYAAPVSISTTSLENSVSPVTSIADRSATVLGL